MLQPLTGCGRWNSNPCGCRQNFELIGDAALDFDRRQRRFGMVYAAENAVKAMEANPIAANMVNSYTQGINQYIQSLTYKDLPLEYKLLDYWPENWSP